MQEDGEDEDEDELEALNDESAANGMLTLAGAISSTSADLQRPPPTANDDEDEDDDQSTDDDDNNNPVLAPPPPALTKPVGFSMLSAAGHAAKSPTPKSPSPSPEPSPEPEQEPEPEPEHDEDEDDIDGPHVDDSELQPMYRHDALDVLAGIELKFAQLRERLFVEKMEELHAEEAMIENGP